MRIKLNLTLLMGFFLGLFPAFGQKTARETDNKTVPPSKAVQNTKQKIVRQTIAGEVNEFSYADFENLPTNKAYDPFFLGDLAVGSGKIVCADPMYRALGFPQNWKVPSGHYPVFIYVALQGDFAGRVAYAEITFSKSPVKSWELSLIDEKSLPDAMDKRLNGYYPVENGLSCFADAETWQRFDTQVSDYQQQNETANFYLDVLEPWFKKNKDVPASSRGEDWANYTPPGGIGNILLFGSGFGDGFYARYVGLDQYRKPVKLITDFIQAGVSEE